MLVRNKKMGNIKFNDAQVGHYNCIQTHNHLVCSNAQL